MIINKIIKLMQSALAKILEIYDFFQRTPYLLEEINTETKQVTIHCRGSRAYIKTTLEGTIRTPNIIKGLPSMHACWIGYYYASSSSKDQQLGFTPQTKRGRFKVISLEMRTSLLTYCDIKTKRVYKEKITDVVQDQYVINNIDPTQACYIGMQAGYIALKKGTTVFNKKTNVPLLRLVK